MSSLISCQSVSKAFGAQTLFNNISLNVHPGDRVGVIGPNGSGKSTLLKIICGLEDADSGEVLQQKFTKLSYLSQVDIFDEAKGLVENLIGALEDTDLEETEKYNRVNSLISRAEFPDRDMEVKLLSGGWKKRLSICRAMLLEPDVLIMDEPTNHLDIEGILWLEKMLVGVNSPTAYLLVSHDRRFLENCTNRIVELSSVYPEGTLQVQGPYSKFIETRETFLVSQQLEEERLANRARREVEWLRRGPKARATKAKYRIDEAYKLSDDLADVKARNRSQSNVRIDFEATGRKTKKLMEIKGVTKGYEGRVLFEDLDLSLAPGSRLGLLGRNGCGKSTLMKILAAGGGEGAVTPDGGEIKAVDNLQIVSFDQNRETIDPKVTLRRALAPEGDSIVFRGTSIHVVSWAQRFLFRPDQLETPVGQLSGGEQARILIAGLMRQPADVLLLDEPTNDLDISSLDVLESGLVGFPGALVLVTHDRFLLDRVCHRVLGFGGRSGVTFYADYEQWLSDLGEKEQTPENKKEKKEKPAKEKKNSGRLSYMDQREYDQIEEKIAEAEEEVDRLKVVMEKPEVQANAEQLAASWSALEKAEGLVETLYGRWDELEDKKEG